MECSRKITNQQRDLVQLRVLGQPTWTQYLQGEDDERPSPTTPITVHLTQQRASALATVHSCNNSAEGPQRPSVWSPLRRPNCKIPHPLRARPSSHHPHDSA